MRNRKKLILTLMVSFLASLAILLLVGLPAGEDDLSEAIFRYEIERERSFNTGSKVFCLALGIPFGERDPGDQFLARFRQLPERITKASNCGIPPATGAVIDKTTGERAKILRVLSVTRRWIGPTQAEGSVMSGNLGGAGFIYRLEREGDSWKVKQADMTWIS